MEILQLTILIPFVLGIAAIFIPKYLFKYGSIFAVFSSVTVIAGGIIGLPAYRFAGFGNAVVLQGEVLSLSLVILTGVFGLLIALYSIGHIDRSSGFFWSLFCWLLASSAGVFLAGKTLILLVSWGVTGLILALMIFQAGKEEIGKKTFIIVGGSDALMLLGLVGMAYVVGTNNLSGISIRLDNPLSWMIYISLLIAAFTKAGAVPFHTWIPDMSKEAPTPVVAFLPASMDKLLGIYLLKKIVVDWFVVSDKGSFLLMAVGTVTIIAAVFMALSQHNLRKLLGYHAVSQVGYMVLGLGTGSIIGIAGGLLHMVNHAIYKQGLFLGAGIIEKETGTSSLKNLGGLGKNFPVTFVSFAICAMAISGIPLFNGFVSKWMIYQAIVDTGKTAGPLWVIWLAAAVFGSALTLASFVKVLHAVFLGQNFTGRFTHAEKLTWELPALIILPLACVIIGIFPQHTVYPVLESILGPIKFPGLWQPQFAAGLLLLGAVIAGVMYAVFKVNKFRFSDTYIGGEKITPEMRVTGAEFYATIENLGIFPKIYDWAKKGYFDIYELLKDFTFYWIKLFRWLHNGMLSIYILWVMVGSVIVFYVVFK